MKIGIFYFTTSGNTEMLAESLESMLKERGHEVLLKQVSDADASDFEGMEYVALGSPAQGTEEMDDTEFLPFYEEHLEDLKGKKIFLFGCFGWGDGQYMEDFAEEAKGDGLDVVGIYTHLETPDDTAFEELQEKVQETL